MSLLFSLLIWSRSDAQANREPLPDVLERLYENQLALEVIDGNAGHIKKGLARLKNK